MKTIVRFSALILFIFYCLHVNSQNISSETAQIIAKSVYSQMAPDSRAVYPEELQISEIYTISHEGFPVYYIMNIGQDDGFVII